MVSPSRCRLSLSTRHGTRGICKQTGWWVSAPRLGLLLLVLAKVWRLRCATDDALRPLQSIADVEAFLRAPGGSVGQVNNEFVVVSMEEGGAT